MLYCFAPSQDLFYFKLQNEIMVLNANHKEWFISSLDGEGWAKPSGAEKLFLALCLGVITSHTWGRSAVQGITGISYVP